MATWKIEHRRCDRCGHTASFDPKNPTALYSWGTVCGGQNNGPFWLGDKNDDKQADICPDCTMQFKDWWGKGKP